MYRRRPLNIAFALWLAAAALACAQSTPENHLDEKIRQADALQEKGDLQAAQTAYESLLEALSPDVQSPQLGHVLNGLSNVASALGNNKDAVDLAQRADDIYRALGDGEGQSYALNSRGIAEQELGQYPTAQASFRAALPLARGIHDFKTEVRTLNNLGNAYYFPGNYLEAMRSYEEALRIVEWHSTESWSDYWRQITKINQATLYQRLGRYQTALQLYKQVGTSSRSLSASDQAHLFMNQGVLYRRLGDPWKALDSYQAALSQYSRQHDDDGEISVLKNMGIVYALDLGDFGKAQRLFQRSLARSEATHSKLEVVQAHLYLGETALRQSDLKSGGREFQGALTLAQQLETVEEQWKAHFGLGRIAELSGHTSHAETEYRKAIAIIETTRTQLQLSALRAEFLADKRDVYDALIALLLAGNDIKGAFSVLERSRARTFQDRLTSGPHSNKQPQEALGMDEVQRYLDGDTVLVEYWLSGGRLATIWCTRQSYGVEQIQLSVAERESMLEFLRQLPDSLQGDWRRQTAVLGQLFPATDAFASNLRHVVIVPDGWLGSVPFDLVPLASDTLLIENYDVSYLPTAALLRRNSAELEPRFPWMREFIAFGSPSLAKPDPGQQPTFENGAEGAELPHSAEEIHSISKMVRGRSDLHLDAGDLRDTFLSPGSHSAPILHVSTHAFADADIPENSRMLFSPDRDGGAPAYVFLRELYDLDLRDVNLATISACNTERGKMIRGEGVQAFSRALLLAGSRSALTTLWRVDDRSTSQFMQQFYFYALVRRQPKAEALRSAKLTFLRSRTELANPAHWAAFVMNGDASGVLPYFVSWGTLVAVTMIVFLALATLAWLLLGSRRRSHRIDRTQRVVSQ